MLLRFFSWNISIVCPYLGEMPMPGVFPSACCPFKADRIKNNAITASSLPGMLTCKPQSNETADERNKRRRK